MNAHSAVRPIKKAYIVGAGFAGLTLAYYLKKKGIKVELFEASGRAGGMLASERLPSGALVEQAANALMASEPLEALCEDLKIELLEAQRVAKRRYIWRAGRASRWPLSLRETAESLGGLWTLFMDRNLRQPRAFESVADWGCRVVGPSFSRHLLSTALQGIYAANADELNAQLVLGRFFNRALSKNKQMKKFKGSVAPRLGMGSLMRALGNHLNAEIHYTKTIDVKDLKHIQNNAQKESAVVFLATPMWVTARLLQDSKLLALPTKGLYTLTAHFSAEARLSINGFGCLFPRQTKTFHAMGVLFNTDIFPSRGPRPTANSLDVGLTETWIFSDLDISSDRVYSAMLADRQKLYAAHPDQRHLKGRLIEPLEWSAKTWQPALPLYGHELALFLKTHSQEYDNPLKDLRLHGNYMGALGLTQILQRSVDMAAQYSV